MIPPIKQSTGATIRFMPAQLEQVLFALENRSTHLLDISSRAEVAQDKATYDSAQSDLALINDLKNKIAEAAPPAAVDDY